MYNTIPMSKIQKFEYITHQLIDWYKSNNKTIDKNDFSKLKVLKLHFFICSASSILTESGNNDLFSHFDKFVAMPYGHVEEDVYNFILHDKTKSFKIDNSRITISDIEPILDSDFTELVKKSILYLKGVNNNLVNQDAFKLVELSHNWFSWKYYFNSARDLGRLKSYIPVDVLRKENKYFIIQNDEPELSENYI